MASTDDRRTANRVPPHNLDAEASLLGAMLLSREAVLTALEQGLRGEQFYKPAHKHIFEAMQALNVGGNPVDAVTVAEELRGDNLLQEVGGLEALLALQNTTPAVSHAERYAEIVKRTATLRRLISVGTEIAEVGYSDPDDVERAVDEAESRIFDIAGQSIGDSAERVDHLVNRVFEMIVERGQHSGITGVPTGFTGLDSMLLGLQPGTLNIVGARPAMGKSAFAMAVAVHAARAANRPVLFFSLEMGKPELAYRILSSEANVESEVLRRGDLNDAVWSKVGNAIGRLDIPLIVDDSPGTTVAQIRAKARRIVSREGPLALIAVDYLQLMGGDARPENRQLEVSEISRKLKLLAREFNVPVVALSQLSRQLESRPDKRPMLSDLRESGALEQDADVVMFLFRPEVHDPDPNNRGKAELILAKHRAGPTGTVHLAWISTLTRFENIATDPVLQRIASN
jgi:replicative DNA helicase